MSSDKDKLEITNGVSPFKVDSNHSIIGFGEMKHL